MTMTVEVIQVIRGEVAGWDPAGLDRATAAAVCRELVDLAATIARTQVLALAEAKTSGALAGFRDPAAWLRAQGLSGARARVLGNATWCATKNPQVRGGLEDGTFTVEHAAELRPVIDLIDDGHCTETELADLLARARTGRVEELRHAVQAVALRAKQHHPRPVGTVHESDTDHGQKQLRAVLNPEDHEIVRNALDRIVDEHWRTSHTDDSAPSPRELPEQRALALVEMARRSLHGTNTNRASTAEVIVIVDAETFLTGELRPGSECRLPDGTPIPPTITHRLAEQAGIRCYTRLPDGTTGLSQRIPIAPLDLDHGRTRRLASYQQRLALTVQHPTCTHCNTPYRHTQAHHKHPWHHGGPTNLQNLEPLCTHHHQLTHQHRPPPHNEHAA